jgi:hypothetical protein
VVGSPGDERLVAFGQALARRDLPAPGVVSYRDLLEAPERLHTALGRPCVLRIESPGASFESHCALVAAGADAHDRTATTICRDEALRLPFERGRILFPRQWYAGLRVLLGVVARAAQGHRVMGDPSAILCMFDKRQCHAWLAAAGLPVAPSLGPITSFEELRAKMQSAGVDRVFVKLAFGSCASGIVAYRATPTGPRAFTTVEPVTRGRELVLFNTRRVRMLTEDRLLAPLIDALAAEGVQVEAWLSRASLDNRPFEVRVLTIAGRARHIVIRLAHGPFGNLHLGARRGDVDRAVSRVGQRSWTAMLRTCEAVAAAFPEHLAIGVDVLFQPGGQQHTVLEANAFGDLLRRTFSEGEDPYDAQLSAVLGPSTREHACAT